MTDKQMQIVIGSLLGDGWLYVSHKNNGQRNWSLYKQQSVLDKDGVDKIDYMVWHFKEMSSYSHSLTKYTINQNKMPFKKDRYYGYKFSTSANEEYTDLAKKWYKMEGDTWVKNDRGRIIKIVPQDIKLTPLSFCVWLMDDGFCYPKDANAILCTHGFTVEEVDFLVERLKRDLSIQSKRRIESRGYPIIYVGRESYFNMIETVKPHVAWDCFKYKLDTTTYKKQHHRGETHSNAKLTEESVKRVFELRDNGMLQKDIAKEIGISKTTVSLLLSGDRWEHLGMKTEIRRKPRISKDTINQIIEMDHQGKAQSEIAALANTSQATISRILKRCKGAAD